MRLLHISDIHYRIQYKACQDGYGSIFRNMTSPLVFLNRCCEHLKAAGTDIDGVLISGDLVEDGGEQDYRALKEKLAEIFPNVPIVVTLGNHDVKHAFYRGWLQRDDGEEAYHHIEKIGDVNIIAMDNSEFGCPDGRIDEKSCTWLEQALEETAGETTLLMMHHHLKSADVVPPCPYAPAFEDIIKDSRLTGILCGHTHHYYHGTFAGKPYYVAGSLSFIGLSCLPASRAVHFEERFGYNDYVIENGRIKKEEIVAFSTGNQLGDIVFSK